MRSFLLVATVGVALAGCQTTMDTEMATTASSMQIATQADMNTIAGKTITREAGQSFVISADGTLNGTWNGKPLVGTYEMRDGFFCRTLSQGPAGPSPEDCQLMMLEGSTITGTRNRGEGQSFVYTVS